MNFVIRVLAAVVVFVGLLVVVSIWPAPGFDVVIHQWFVTHRSGWLTSVAIAVTDSASSLVAVPLMLVLWLALGSGPVWRRLIPTGVLIVGVLARTGVSELVVRQRPPSSDWAYEAVGYSFPSGHSAGSALFAGLAAMVVVQRFPRWAWLTITIAVAYPLAIGLTRIYLGVHWPTDVLGGWTFAAVWLLVLHRMSQPAPKQTNPAQAA